MNQRKRQKQKNRQAGHVDPVNLNRVELLTPEACHCSKQKRIIAAVRDPTNLVHLQKVLEEMDPEKTEVIVLTAKVAKGYQLEGELAHPLPEEERLFTQVIAIAEKVGRTVTVLSIPTNDPYYAMARTAYDLKAQELALGKSGKFSPEVQMEEIAVAWGAITPSDEEERPLRIRIIWEGAELKGDL